VRRRGQQPRGGKRRGRLTRDRRPGGAVVRRPPAPVLQQTCLTREQEGAGVKATVESGERGKQACHSPGPARVHKRTASPTMLTPWRNPASPPATQRWRRTTGPPPTGWRAPPLTSWARAQGGVHPLGWRRGETRERRGVERRRRVPRRRRQGEAPHCPGGPHFRRTPEGPWGSGGDGARSPRMQHEEGQGRAASWRSQIQRRCGCWHFLHRY
jgi:hypothetical protein